MYNIDINTKIPISIYNILKLPSVYVVSTFHLKTGPHFLAERIDKHKKGPQLPAK